MPHHEYTEETQAKMQAMRELIRRQASQIEDLKDRNKILQGKLLSARLASDNRSRVEHSYLTGYEKDNDHEATNKHEQWTHEPRRESNPGST